MKRSSIHIQASSVLIDAGNSRIKTAFLKNEVLGRVAAFSSLAEVLSSFSTRHFDSAIVSSVRSPEETCVLKEGLLSVCDKVQSVAGLSRGLIRSRYDLKQLGEDRLAKLLYARFTQKIPCVLVDAGTALTLEFFAPPDVFLGGFICGGFSLEYQALSEKTKKLPRVIPASKSLSRLPKNTEEAIQQGVQEIKALGVRALIEKIWKQNKITSSRARILLTGGEAKLLLPYFPEAQVHENLVLEGLQALHKNGLG